MLAPGLYTLTRALRIFPVYSELPSISLGSLTQILSFMCVFPLISCQSLALA